MTQRCHYQRPHTNLRRCEGETQNTDSHAWPGPPYGKVIKTQETTTHKRAKGSALSEQVITRLQGTGKKAKQGQTHHINNKNYPQKKQCPEMFSKNNKTHTQKTHCRP